MACAILFQRICRPQFVLLRLPAPPLAPTPARKVKQPLSKSRIERDGLKPGTAAPDFILPDVYGRPVSLQDYRGRRVLLVFSDPHCGPCNELAPHLVRAHRRRGENTPEIVVVSRGDAEDIRQKAEANGFEFPVVLQDRWKLSKKYGIFATPVAFLIGEDGRTEREVAVGFDAIRDVLRQEFRASRVEKLFDTVDDVSNVFAAPVRRRDAVRVAGYIVAGALLSAIGMEKTALAVCGGGQIACGTACCNSSTERCCNSATNLCCPLSLVCCFGKCCAPTEVCLGGQCRQQVQP